MPTKISPDRSSGSIKSWKPQDIGDTFRGLYLGTRPVTNRNGKQLDFDESVFETDDGRYSISSKQVTGVCKDIRSKRARIEVVAEGRDSFHDKEKDEDISYLVLEVYQYGADEDFDACGPVDDPRFVPADADGFDDDLDY